MAGHIKKVIRNAMRRYNPRSKIYVNYDLGANQVAWPVKLVKDAKNLLKTLPSGSYITIDNEVYKTKKGHGRGYPPMASMRESELLKFIKDVIIEEAKKSGNKPDMYQVSFGGIAWAWQKKHRSSGDGHMDQDEKFIAWNTHVLESKGFSYEYEDDEGYVSLK